MTVTVIHGDSREVLKALPDCSIDSIVTDPPYSLQTINKRFAKVGRNDKTWSKSGPHQRTARGFMNQKWDTGETAFDPEFWTEALRVLKPGGHLIAFGGTRTFHRLASAIEDAGFEIRDLIADLIASDTAVAAFMASLNEEQRLAFVKCIDASQFGGMLLWTFGSGFPKSHNVAKGIDKAAGREIEIVPRGAQGEAILGADQNKVGWEKNNGREYQPGDFVPSDEAAPWSGWGTALKPALEPICLARKPLDGTVAANVVTHGAGALNVEGCRIDAEKRPDIARRQDAALDATRNTYGTGINGSRFAGFTDRGRWPANVVHDGSEEVLAGFPATQGQKGAVLGTESNARNVFNPFAANAPSHPRGDEGSAARFFYSAKADASDRLGSKHPTVKPVDLMRWLVRLVTPPGGHVLDPFAGSGTTGMACLAEGFHATLIEREAEYVTDIRRRLAHVSGADTPLFAAGGQ